MFLLPTWLAECTLLACYRLFCLQTCFGLKGKRHSQRWLSVLSRNCSTQNQCADPELLVSHQLTHKCSSVRKGHVPATAKKKFSISVSGAAQSSSNRETKHSTTSHFALPIIIFCHFVGRHMRLLWNHILPH